MRDITTERIYEVFRLLREEKGWSAREMASRLGIKTNYVYEMELGTKQVGMDKIIQFSTLLNVPVRHVFLMAQMLDKLPRGSKLNYAHVRGIILTSESSLLAEMTRLNNATE